MLLLLGCGDSAADGGLFTTPDSGARRDAMSPTPPTPPPPGMPEDGGSPSDAGPTRVDTDANEPMPPAPMDDVREDWAACGDGEVGPTESDGLADCASASCATAPVCCADSEACCVTDGAALSVAFDGCVASGLDDACLGDLEVLGDARPVLMTDGASGALWLASDGPAYVTVASRTELDPSTAIDATLALATRTSCPPGACQEMVGVGLAEIDAPSPEDAELAAVLSVATGQLLLLSRGAVVRRGPVDVSTTSAGNLSIAIDAAGAATATFESERGVTTSVRADGAVRLTRPLRVIAFGRGENAREAAIVVRSLSAQTRVCDRPTAWAIEPVAVTNGRELPGAWTALAVADGIGPSGTERRFVIEAGGRVYAGLLEADGLTFQTGDGGALRGEYPGGGTSTESLGGLVYVPSLARWELYLARSGRDIVRIPSADGATFQRLDAVPVVTVSEIAVAAESDVVSIDQPSVAIDHRGYLTLAYRARNLDGRTWIGSARSYGDGVVHIDGDALRPSERADSFDRDGVESPSLIAYSELTHLYYTGRRGVATSLGLLRRTVTGGFERYDESRPVLSPGVEAWRTFGVAAPALAVRPTTSLSATLDVYFLATGTDGVSLQRAHREVPWLGH